MLTMRCGAALATALLATAVEAQTRTIKGTISDGATGEPVAGAAVLIVGTELSATTAVDGVFNIGGAPASPIQLAVTMKGYRAASVALAEDQSELKLSIQRELEEEIVVTGRASRTERRNAAVSVAKIRAEEIADVPAQTVDQAMQGKIAGANIQRNDGSPGGGVQVRLRGVSSINASAEPLFVVDGVIASNASVPSGLFNVTKSNLGGNHSVMQDSVVNRMADFNAEDVESIEVLKGSAAAAIYGAKASNGVVIINTKRGKAGPPRIDFTQRFGISTLAKKIGSRTYGSLGEVLDTFCPAGAGGQRAPACVAAQTQAYGDGTVYDHDAEVAGRHDLAAESILSVSGGSRDFRYFASGAVKNDPGLINNTGYQKQGLRLNLGKDINDRWTLNFTSNLLHSDARRGLTNNDNTNTSHWVVFSGTPSFLNLNPNADGSYPANPYAANLNNPLQTVSLMGNNESVWRFTSSGDSIAKLYVGEEQQLRLLVNGGVDRFQQENDLLFPPELLWQQTSALHGATGYASTTSLNLNLGVNLVHDWRPRGGQYMATSSAGFQYESTDLRTFRLFSQNLTAGQSSIDAGTQSLLGEGRDRVHDRGGYVQEELLLLDRRLTFSAALRGDSSSANGNPNAVYFYPKASASYRFLAPLPRVDDFKLRAAYGETGNHPLYGARFTALQANQNLGGNPGIGVNFICSPAAPGNGACAGDPNIRPERSRELEIGADLSAFEGGATLEVNLYQRTISDLLLQHAVPASSGWTAEWSNGGLLRNRGVEVMLTAQPRLPYDLQLQSVVGFSRNVSEVRSLPGGSFITGGFGASLGVFQIEQGASATQIVGDAGLNPDGTCCVIKKLGDAEPDFMMHFSSRLQWRGFALSFLLDWSYGGSVINLTRLLYDANSNSADWNTGGQQRFNHWLAKYADAYIESASFLKMREVTVSYDFPSTAVGRLWSSARRARLSVSARNLFTITPYSSWDPEVSNFANQPIYRNIEVTPYPPSRSFWTSIDVGFY